MDFQLAVIDFQETGMKGVTRIKIVIRRFCFLGSFGIQVLRLSVIYSMGKYLTSVKTPNSQWRSVTLQ